tara:strand:+ start:278 stop:472 length:195 start_codon:yes stop_codon:yes gene_type:complete
MAIYTCDCKEFEVKGKTSIRIVNDNAVTPEAYCEDCKTYGKEKRDHQGFGGIIKRKGGKIGKIK